MLDSDKSFISLLLCIFFSSVNVLHAQAIDKVYIHSHNDYEQRFPLITALQAEASSIEIDVHLSDDKQSLIVAHDREELSSKRTLQKLYIQPLTAYLNGSIEDPILENLSNLHLLFDIKGSWEESLAVLINELAPLLPFIDGTDSSKLKVIISGDIPPPSAFNQFPNWLLFDGRFSTNYSEEQLKRVALFSASFKDYTVWGGKGIPVLNEENALKVAIKKAHSLGKPIRFWATPDSKTTWDYLIRLGVDFLNTDQPIALRSWLKKQPKSQVELPNLALTHQIVADIPPKNGRPKNIILFIVDGMGLAQLSAAQTVAGGLLNMTKDATVGLIKTQSSDAYSTDSAAGATAMATGIKSHNRAIGVNSKDEVVKNLVELLAEQRFRTAIITTDSFDGATPSAFYAHQKDRDAYAGIQEDLWKSPLNGLVAVGNIESVKSTSEKWKVASNTHFSSFAEDSHQIQLVGNDKGNWLATSLRKNLDQLKNEQGFFLMVEGAKVDNGGHANDLPYLVQELLLVDNAIGEAKKWAMQEETLILVTADHETGGLIVHNGNEEKGMVTGAFYSDDHTGIMVPIFAWGPQADAFIGVYSNTEIFTKILDALQLESK